MIEATRSQDLTIKDVVNGLESMERWTHELREALATLDQEQRLDFNPRLAMPSKQPPLVTGGVCAPPDTRPKPTSPGRVRKLPKPKKTTKK